MNKHHEMTGVCACVCVCVCVSPASLPCFGSRASSEVVLVLTSRSLCNLNWFCLRRVGGSRSWAVSADDVGRHCCSEFLADDALRFSFPSRTSKRKFLPLDHGLKVGCTKSQAHQSLIVGCVVSLVTQAEVRSQQRPAHLRRRHATSSFTRVQS